jgi:hypothetical protein
MLGLVASLAVNVLTVSIIATSLWEWQSPSSSWPSRFPSLLAQFTRTLPAERARQLGAVIEAGEPAIKAQRGEMRQTRRELGQMLRADAWDKERFVAAQNRLLEQETSLRRAQMRLFVDVAEKMSADERRAFLKWRRENVSAGRRNGGKDDDKTGQGSTASR